MPTPSMKHQIIRDKTVQGIDGHEGKLFQAFSRGETLAFSIKFTTNPIITDLSGYQLFVSMTDASLTDSCGEMDASQFAEAQLSYDGTLPDDGNIYLFSGKITDEQTIQLPEGQYAVVGAIKYISPGGDSDFADKALITVFPCRNPRLDQV